MGEREGESNFRNKHLNLGCQREDRQEYYKKVLRGGIKMPRQ